MTLQNFIGKINWRQILVHLVAFWFFIQAAYTFSYLYDIKLINAARYANANGKSISEALDKKGVTLSDITYFFFWTGISGFIGLVSAFLISLGISLKRKWGWINSVITLVISYVLYKFNLMSWSNSKKVFWKPAYLLSNTTFEFIFPGSVFLILGLLIFFLKRPTQFIENRKNSVV